MTRSGQVTASRRPSEIDTFVPRAQLLAVFAPHVALILEQLGRRPTAVNDLAALTGLSKHRTRRLCDRLFEARRIIRAEKWGPWTLSPHAPPLVDATPDVTAPEPPPRRTVVANGEEFEVIHCGADSFSGYQSRGGSSLSSDAFRLRTHR